MDDRAAELEPGQLRQTEFLDQLWTAVCAEADGALAGTGRSTDGCPYLAGWFDYYRGQTSVHVESALHRYAPETRSVRTAEEYIPLLAARVRQGVGRWAGTGEIVGVPAELPGLLPGRGGLAGGVRGLAAGVGQVLFKAIHGRARLVDDPQAIQQRLGGGRPLENSVRRRMERAFARSFAHVRAHTDATARRLSTEQNARAFTVGEHVAFGSGEYRPGTLAGDTLIAHELAHVVQQDGGGTPQRSEPDAGYGALEEDADRSALGVLTSLWGRQAPSGSTTDVAPVRRSGLRLQRCGPGRSRPASRSPAAEPAGAPRPAPPGQTREAAEAAEPAADEAAAVRARAIDTLVSDAQCQPTPIALNEMAAIPGASPTSFGWTKAAQLSRSISPRFDRGTRECFLGRFVPVSLSFDHMVYVKPGDHRYGTQTRYDATCAKDLPLFVRVTPAAARLFKAGEVEHCRDLHHAFELTGARFNAAAAAVRDEGRFPAKNPGDCTAQLKAKIESRMGFGYDRLGPIFDCLALKSKERDTNGWHNVDVNLARKKETDAGCTRIVHVLDESRILPEVGTHPTGDLIKGCGEPQSP